MIADRHLTNSTPTAPELAAENRRRLVAYEPEYVVDGLGPLNPRLAITNYPDLSYWMNRYREVGRTRTTVIYGLRNRGLP